MDNEEILFGRKEYEKVTKEYIDELLNALMKKQEFINAEKFGINKSDDSYAIKLMSGKKDMCLFSDIHTLYGYLLHTKIKQLSLTDNSSSDYRSLELSWTYSNNK